MASPLTLPSSGAAIVCVGFMGAGKSTAARSAAQALGIEAVDVDELLERRLGKPIDEVFSFLTDPDRDTGWRR